MKILITGITGFLGSAIARRLVNQEGVRITGIKRSFSNTSRIQKICHRIELINIDQVPLSSAFEKGSVDVVVHCATNYGRGNECRSDMLESNLILPLRLMEASINCKVLSFINTDTMLDKGISDYALSKRQFNDWFRIYSSEVMAINVALEHFFGAGDNPSKFVSFVIREMLAGVPSIPLTEGVQKRDFVHIDDVVSAFETIIRYAYCQGERRVGYEAFEVGRGEAVSVREFVLMIRDIVGNYETRLDFGALPYRENEVMSIRADISKVMGLGWRPALILKEALSKTINEERQSVCRNIY